MSNLRLLLFIYLSMGLNLSAQAQEETALQMVRNLSSSLVEVHCVDTKTINAGNGRVRTGTFQSQGAGIIIDSHGIILTNTHVIANAPHINVALSDGTILEAKLVYSSDADFSFIKIEPPHPLPTINWGDSSQTPIGTAIVAISSGEDNQEHVLGGAITNLLRGMSSNNVEMLELNLNLFHGDSGGPLLDQEGHLLGIIMGKKNSEDHKSYAIAANKIHDEYNHFARNIP